MNVKEMYLKAQEKYKEKNYDAALKLIDKIKKRAPNNKKAYDLEADIWGKLNHPVKKYYALKKILPLLDLSSTSNEEKIFNVYVFARLGDVSTELSLTQESMVYYSSAIEYGCSEENSREMMHNIIFLANAVESFRAENFLALYKKSQKLWNVQNPYKERQFYDHEKIRIGYLSSDFGYHVVMTWSWALFHCFDRNRFKIYCYSNSKEPDNVTNNVRSIVDGWREIYDLTDEEAAKLIHDDEIDILFDLNGHTRGNRLRVASYRPASVQISGIGYMNSTGLDCFDYFLSDVHCACDETYFTEKVIKLPYSHICYEPMEEATLADVPPCIKNKFVTFGSFNSLKKVTDSILITWKKILDAVPNSRLILKNKIFDTDDGKKFLGERLKSFGFDLSRVEMRPFSTDWLVEYNDVDIALDTFSYTGGVTTCEALYMGVPVISLYGDRHGTRFGLSILNNVGLYELAVDSYDEYVKRAVVLANDWELLTILKKNLRVMMKKSPLMDSVGYVREVEKVFIKILNDKHQS